MNKIKTYVSKLLKDFFNDDDKKELIEILTTSLEEKVDDLVEAGTPLDEAINKSINEFGDVDDVLKVYPELDKKQSKIKKRKHQFLFSLWGYLIISGIAIFINFTFIEFFANILWFVVILIALLFWPITMLYRYLMVTK
ncbi:MAG: permease prefix domain 1-containing protein [Candidatus Izemoplasmatales bacterium]|nr:permease prefix domain 1-containing protein [Candidatus Izemoplasmatales bacterium]